jgi:hypothetical protein
MRERTLAARPLPALRSTSQAPPADDPGGPTLDLLKAPAQGVAAAGRLLKRLFRSFEGHLSMRLWNGDGLRLGRCAPGNGQPPFTLIIRNPGAISAMVLGFDRLRFAEAYFRGNVDIEGDFFCALGLKDHLDSIRLTWRDRLALLLPALRLQSLKRAWPGDVRGLAPAQGPAVNAHSRSENQAAVGFHDDVSRDGQLDTVSNILRAMERGGFEVADVESLRSHYAMTLRRWVARLEQHHEQALQHVDEATYRCWRLYMAACALEFESGEIGVYQLLATKRTTGLTALPLTRRHLYAEPTALEGQTT